MMGTGKSTVGRAMTERIGWPYVDNDDVLHADTGLFGADLLARDGEKALREAEAHVLAQILQRDPPLVAGVAAGAVLRPDDREQMKEHAFNVWLRARIETLVERIGDDEERAWLQPDPEAALRSLAEGRDPLYAEVADFVVDVDDKDASTIVDELLTVMKAH